MPAQPHWRTRLLRVALLVTPAKFFYATEASQIAFEAIPQFPETDVDKADLENLIGDLIRPIQRLGSGRQPSLRLI